MRPHECEHRPPSLSRYRSTDGRESRVRKSAGRDRECGSRCLRNRPKTAECGGTAEAQPGDASLTLKRAATSTWGDDYDVRADSSWLGTRGISNDICLKAEQFLEGLEQFRSGRLSRNSGATHSLNSIVATWRHLEASLKKEYAMKLNSAQVQRTLGQFEARVIPDNHPVISQLNDLFGQHTFFLDQHGLNIVEPVEAAEPAGECAKVVNLASWSDDDSRSGLELHEPAATEIVVTLG
jgi:hypothetical protein